MKLKSTRQAYGEALEKLGENNQVVVVDADLSVSTLTNKFAKKYPERFFNVGCAEQNLIGVAAGLAISGKITFASTYAIFLTKAWEQIRNTIARDNLNVKIVVAHAGLTNAPDGSSHHSLEDIALMRVIPNMSVIIPADAVESEKVIFSEERRLGPTYIRLNRIETPIIFDENYDFRFGKTDKLIDGSDITIFATGTMVCEALDAVKELKEKHVNASLINVHTIKPLDKEQIIKEARKTGLVVTVEEHSIYGGLGSAIAEILVENYPVPMKIIGTKDIFTKSGYYYIDLLQKFGLTSEYIFNAVNKLLKTK